VLSALLDQVPFANRVFDEFRDLWFTRGQFCFAAGAASRESAQTNLIASSLNSRQLRGYGLLRTGGEPVPAENLDAISAPSAGHEHLTGERAVDMLGLHESRETVERFACQWRQRRAKPGRSRATEIISLLFPRSTADELPRQISSRTDLWYRNPAIKYRKTIKKVVKRERVV
jgi:hypothetical protein